MRAVLTCLLLVPMVVQAAQPNAGASFNDGLNFANSTLKGSVENTARTAQPQNVVPQYAGTNVPETGYAGLGSGLTSTAQGAVATNSTAAWFQSANASRPRFTLNPATDPILTYTDSIATNPNAIVGSITGTYQGCAPQQNPSATSYTTEYCTEWADTVPLTCQRTLDVTVSWTNSCTAGTYIASGIANRGNAADNMEARIICDLANTSQITAQIHAYGGRGDCHGGWITVALDPTPHAQRGPIATLKPDWFGSCQTVPVYEEGGCNGNNCTYTFTFEHGEWQWQAAGSTNVWVPLYFTIQLNFTRPHQVANETDNWTNGCATLRQREAAGECTLTSPETCIDGPSTRVINGQSVTRSCWVYETGFDCLGTTTTPEPYCQELLNRGCFQVNSTCVNTMADGTCAEYQQEYKCPNGTVGGGVVNCGVETFCIDGSCAQNGYQPSSDFALAASYLSAAAETAIDFDRTTREAFKGTFRSCVKTATAFTNCCKTAGWGVNLGVTQCTQDEILLSQERQAGKCHYVGNYKKGQLFWTKTYQGFCCFGSKLGRIIQEQARPLLNVGWGPPDNPDCRGLTMVELTSIDWSLMDLSEFFADVIANTSGSLPNVQQLETQLKTQVQNYISNQGSGP